MNTPLPPDRDDDLPDEVELAALYRKLPKREPGAALDAAVLRAAAQALGQQPGDMMVAAPSSEAASQRSHRARARPSRPHWLIALSSAATLILVGGLAWHMRGMPTVETAAFDTATPASERAASAAPMQVTAPPVPAQAEPSSPQALAAATSRPIMRAARRPSSSPPTRSVEPIAMPFAQSLALKTDKPVPDRNASIGGTATDERAEAAPAAVAMKSAPTITSAGNDNLSATMTATAPASVAMAEKADATESEARVAAKDKTGLVSIQASTLHAPSSTGSITATAARVDDTPAQELEKIRQLFVAHHDDEARQRLKAFQQAHPASSLPPELRARLRKP